MAEGPGELCETTKPDGDHIWNSSRAIEGLIVYLKLQIDYRLESLDPRNI